MPKLLFVCSSLTRGGSNRVAVDLVNWLAARGWQINFICMNTRDPMAMRDELASSITLWPMPRYAISQRLFDRVIRKLRGGSGARLGFVDKVIERTRPDLIIVNTIFHLDVNDLALARGIPCVRYTYEAPMYFFQLSDADHARMLNPAMHIVACSNDVAAFIKLYYQRDVDLVSQPSTIIPHHSQPGARPIEGPYRVVAAGGADFRKGFDMFCAIADRVLTKHGDVIFEWFGRQADSDFTEMALRRLRPELRNRLRLKGFVSKLPEHLHGAAAFALTSREDPYPIVVLEALAAGVPVIGFDSCMMRDVVASGAGNCIERYDLDAFSAAIVRRLDIIRRGGAATVDATALLDRLQPERMFDDFERYLETLLPR